MDRVHQIKTNIAWHAGTMKLINVKSHSGSSGEVSQYHIQQSVIKGGNDA